MQGPPLPTDDAPADQPAGVEQPAPLITGETPFLATGVVAVIFVMVLILILIGRWRVASRTRTAVDSKDFFQPAGEGAEITFEDAEAQNEAAPDEDYGAQPDDAPPVARKRKSSPFAGLFGRRDRNAEAPEAVLDPAGDDPQFAAVSISREIGDDDESEPRLTPPAVNWSTIENEARRRAEEEAEIAALERARRDRETAEEARWRAEEEEHRKKLAEDDRRRAERDSAAQAAASDTHHFAAEPAVHDDIGRSLSEFEEALHVQREAIQAETRGFLDSFARRFSDRLDALARAVEQHAARSHDANLGSSAADPVAFEEILRRLDDHRHQVDRALKAFSERLDAAPADTEALRSELADLKQSISGAATPSAPSVQLSDIVRNALAPAGYEFNAVLANNRRADCLIRLSRPPGPIAIDARFPVEAFHALHERRSEAAENEFRRTALRHIAGVAERLISPGFTADSAILFLPSESMASEIHARFPDIVQDSYRARVWIVSPTTLMATLHTLSAFLRDASARAPAASAESVARRALSEIDRLSARIAALEHDAPPPRRQEPQDLLSANDAAEWRPGPAQTGDVGEKPTPTAASSAAGERLPDDHHAGDARHQTQARPPFPLR